MGKCSLTEPAVATLDLMDYTDSQHCILITPVKLNSCSLTPRQNIIVYARKLTYTVKHYFFAAS